MDYEKIYHLVFNAATDAIEDLNAMNFGAAKERLIAAQQQAEELYLEETDPE